MLEYYVHLEPEDLPKDLVFASADVPEDVSRATVAVRDLSRRRRQSPAPAELRTVGDTFVAEGRTAILIVPSVVVPDETNWLLNPAHSDFKRIAIRTVDSFDYDRRMKKRSANQNPAN
jgi:RES domain-containing protein